MQQRQPDTRQLHLFSPAGPPTALPSEIRQRTLALIGALLREAASQVRETEHEDHA
jgi:hypothetical protein